MNHKEKKGNNITLMQVTIVILLIIIAILAFFLGKNYSGNNGQVNNTNNSQETGLVAEAGKIGLDTKKLKECVSSDKYDSKIKAQQKVGAEVFGVTGTPGNVLINNETGEYEVLAGAYPTESFVKIIDKLLSNETTNTNENSDNTEIDNSPVSISDDNGKLRITVIDDKRCNDCKTDELIAQLKLIPGLSEATIDKFDYSNPNAQKVINENNIKALPAVIFSNNEVEDKNIKQYLTSLDSGSYLLQIGATFDPNSKRSEKGFLVIDKDTLNKIKEDSYIKGNKDAKITWLEYSDLECPFCAKLHNSSTPSDITSKYGEDINIIFNHFPLDFHKNAMPGARLLECAGEQGGSDAFYDLMKTSFKLGIQK